jgi:peptidoglycan/LPS O-acetylase OafA/YrhL
MAHPLSQIAQRQALIDNLKGAACLFIILHHLAVYGPMSDVAIPALPKTIDFLFEYGRMAVSVFLVIGGYLSGLKLCKANLFTQTSVFDLIAQKYLRLVVPYLAAIGLTIFCSFIAHHWMVHDSISNLPEPAQLVSHLFFLQNILGYESLSAGLWYVAIDFQLFTVSALLIFLIEKLSPASWPFRQTRLIYLVSVAALTISSLFIFNRNDDLDIFFIYFFASYGLGFLSAWFTHEKKVLLFIFLVIDLLALALYIDYRERILFSGITALILCLGTQYHWSRWQIWKNPLAKLGQISYSIFLIHFPISLLVSSLWSNLYAQDPWMNVLGMFLSASLSILLAIPFYHLIEKR